MVDPPTQKPKPKNTSPTDQVPVHLLLLLIGGLVVAGPVVFFSFVLGGATAAIVALAICSVLFVSLYIIAGRSATK